RHGKYDTEKYAVGASAAFLLAKSFYRAIAGQPAQSIGTNCRKPGPAQMTALDAIAQQQRSAPARFPQWPLLHCLPENRPQLADRRQSHLLTGDGLSLLVHPFPPAPAESLCPTENLRS